MSAVILTSFWRQLHEQPLKVEEQIRKYQELLENVRKNAPPRLP
jgi:hypothetical protein